MGRAHVGDERAVENALFPTRRLGKLSRNGVLSGEPGAEVGAVEYPPPEVWEEYELSKIRGDPTLSPLPFKLAQDREPLPLYGLLTARLRPIFVIDGEEDIRCIPCNNFDLPLFFDGNSMGIALECSIGAVDELPTSSIASAIVIAMVSGCRRRV